MRVLIWHVHGSWTTSFVQGRHEYLVPVLPDRGPDGRGRARTWDWPGSVTELSPDDLRATAADGGIDAVVLQRRHEVDLVHDWTGLRAGVDVPAVYVEHDTPREHAVTSRHPLAAQSTIPVVHVTWFNHLMWDCGDAPTRVVEHGIIDPGALWTGEDPSLAVVVNEPVRRGRIAGTDLVVRLGRELPLHVYGMGMTELGQLAPHLAPTLHEDYPQAEMHRALGRHRVYLHPYRWTSLGLSLLEAMTIGMPVLALSTTEAPRAVPPEAGLLSNDPAQLESRAREWLADPGAAAAAGAAAREHALAHYGVGRFLADWDEILTEVGS
ncbi:glycosyltransferase [Dietzia aurantiaca]|uniref:glycosyltransferase n=1 Tax=Dietzia aurantiaca TaxID=983873 RepID=UPI001E425BD3|nr:glycosyltransferase [Dietzia aurantiaca]